MQIPITHKTAPNKWDGFRWVLCRTSRKYVCIALFIIETVQSLIIITLQI